MFEKIYDLLIANGGAKTILQGFWSTIEISALSLLLGTLLGLVICALRMSRFKPFSLFARIYITILRGSPLTMVLMLMYYCVFAKTHIQAKFVAVITFGINTAAYVAELLRSGLEAVNKRESEASLTLGFSKFQTMRYVVLPQALHISKPVYQSTIINLIQWTSVVGYVTITDLTRVINNISSRTMQPLFLFTVGILLYIGVAYLVVGIFALTDLLSKIRKNGES